jgi:hypothetical protein
VHCYSLVARKGTAEAGSRPRESVRERECSGAHTKSQGPQLHCCSLFELCTEYTASHQRKSTPPNTHSQLFPVHTVRQQGAFPLHTLLLTVSESGSSSSSSTAAAHTASSTSQYQPPCTALFSVVLLLQLQYSVVVVAASPLPSHRSLSHAVQISQACAPRAVNHPKLRHSYCWEISHAHTHTHTIQ